MGIVTVGSACNDETSVIDPGRTSISKLNPANADGTINTICVDVTNSPLVGAQFGSMLVKVAYTQFQCKGNTSGTVIPSQPVGLATMTSAGGDFPAFLTETGHYAGMYNTGGNFGKAGSGSGGYWQQNGDQIGTDVWISYNNTSSLGPVSTQFNGVTPSSDMTMTGNGNPITNGSDTPSASNDTDFEGVDSGEEKKITYTILNTAGTADLILTDDPAVVITGSAAFTLDTDASTPIAPAGSTTFIISYIPSEVGLDEAMISIANNADDPFTFDIAGTGLNPDFDAEYLFNIAGGLTPDNSGNGNTLTLVNSPTQDTVIFKEGDASINLNAGLSEMAYVIDGNLNASFPLKNGNNGDFFIGIWEYATTNTSNMCLVSKRYTGAPYTRSFHLNRDGGKTPTFYYNDGTSGSAFYIGNQGQLGINRWYWHGISYTRATDTILYQLYDAQAGVKLFELTDNAVPFKIGSCAAPLTLGAYDGGTIRYNGNMDAVQFDHNPRTFAEMDVIRGEEPLTPLKLSGSTTENSTVVIINESDWTTETVVSGIVGNFEISPVVSGTKTVLARTDFGDVIGFGKILPTQ